MRPPWWVGSLAGWLAAVAGPAVLTAALAGLGGAEQRDYVFLYLGLVATLGVLSGLWPAAVSAALSFLLVDYFFVPPIRSLSIAREEDVVNLLAFAATASIVGLLASQRRRALLCAEALTGILRQSNSELARLNKEQAAAAQAAVLVARSQERIRALEETDRLRRELLANVSHELRTPLSTILAASTSRPAIDDADANERRRRAVVSEAERLKAIVDDMLDLAVIEAGTLDLNLEPVQLAEAISAAAERLHRRSPGRAVRWDECPASLDVLADWGRLLQVLDNLLANADRIAPPDTAIEVSAALEAPRVAVVRVRDHGPGVSPEVRHRLFDRFVRGPQVGGAGGTGLGLAIVRGLVEAHAGSVALEDTEEGACFRFTLPIADADEV
jgi:K+-sensing histidine kinase KdpD